MALQVRRTIHVLTGASDNKIFSLHDIKVLSVIRKTALNSAGRWRRNRVLTSNMSSFTLCVAEVVNSDIVGLRSAVNSVESPVTIS
jgi:hypothetical protein